MTTPSSPRIRAVGIPWYRREDYPRILRIMADADKLPPTWDKWFYRAEQFRHRVEKSRQVAVKAYIDPDEFPAWCEARGLNVDAQARMAFANEAAFRQHGGTH